MVLNKRNEPELAYGVALAGLDIEPNDASLHLTLARIQEKRDDLDSALEEGYRAMQLAPEQEHTYSTIAFILEKRNDWEGVVNLCETASSAGADSADLRATYINALHQRSKDDNPVLNACEKALKDYPNSVNVMRCIVYVLSYRHQFEHVRDVLVRIDSSLMKVQDWKLRAYAESHQKNYAGVIHALSHVPEGDRNQQDWLTLAFAYNGLLCNDQALIAFERAREMGEFEDPKTQSTYGLVLAEIGDESAVSWCQKAVSATKDRPSQEQALWLLDLGVAIRKTKSAKETIPVLKQAVSLNPTTPQAHYALARAYEENDEREEAKCELRKALELNPHYQKARQKLTELESCEG